MMRKTLDSTRLDYEKEMERLRHLQQEIMKQEALVKHFENSNEGYIKIRKTAEEKVISILSDAKPLLRIALLSLIESMRKDPSKYSSLIYHNTSSTADYSCHYYSAASYGQQQQHPSQDYIDVLIQEAEKLYNKIAKELGDKVLVITLLIFHHHYQCYRNQTKRTKVIQDKQQQQLFRVTCIQQNIDCSIRN
jgi:hypothetical protein